MEPIFGPSNVEYWRRAARQVLIDNSAYDDNGRVNIKLMIQVVAMAMCGAYVYGWNECADRMWSESGPDDTEVN